MKYSLILAALLLPGCKVDDSLHEVTGISAAVAEQDGVLLATYRLTPDKIVVGNSFRFELKEAFVARRLMMNSSRTRKRLIDSTLIHPKLVLVGTDDSEEGILGVGREIEILDSASIRQYGFGLGASQPFTNAFAFDLEPVDTFRCQEFKIKLMVGDEQRQTKTFLLTATPIKCPCYRPPAYVHQPFAIRLKARSKPDLREEHRLQRPPTKTRQQPTPGSFSRWGWYFE